MDVWGWERGFEGRRQVPEGGVDGGGVLGGAGADTVPAGGEGDG